MSNPYSTLTNAELNRAIAERLGGRVVNGRWWTPEWDGGFTSPGFMTDWAGDIKAAMELAEQFVAGDVQQRGVDVRCRLTGNPPRLWNAAFAQLLPFKAIEWLGQDADPARAIAIAFLLFRDAADKGEGKS